MTLRVRWRTAGLWAVFVAVVVLWACVTLQGSTASDMRNIVSPSWESERDPAVDAGAPDAGPRDGGR